MSATPVTNWGKVTVSTDYDASATSIVLTTGHGSRLPSTFTYPLTWYNATDYPDPADDPNREIVTVTTRAGDTLTVTRGAEGSGASTKNTASKTYKMILGITKAMWESIFAQALPQDFRNLQLQNHPDSDKAANQVRLTHADSIIMNDTQKVDTWDDLDCDITVSGIGGLDTGSRTASVWYEIYAMYNGTTKALQLHRTKDYFLDEDVTAGEDATQGCRSNVDNSTVKVAQGFKVDTSGPLEFIDVKLIKVGAPTGNYYITVEADSAGVPSNTPLATTDKRDVSRLTTTSEWVRLPFRTPATLSAATQYHLVLQGDWTVSGTNYMGWRMDGSAAAYANGSKALFDSDTSTWTTDGDDDLVFKAYIARNDTALTLNGYTQYALIGYVYNASGNVLVPFRQTGHNWQYGNTLADGLVVNETASTVTLVDMRVFLPPLGTITASLLATGTGAGATLVSLADIIATDLATGVAGVVTGSSGVQTVETPANPAPIILSYLAFYYDASPGADIYIGGFEW